MPKLPQARPTSAISKRSMVGSVRLSAGDVTPPCICRTNTHELLYPRLGPPLSHSTPPQPPQWNTYNKLQHNKFTHLLLYYSTMQALSESVSLLFPSPIVSLSACMYMFSNFNDRRHEGLTSDTRTSYWGMFFCCSSRCLWSVFSSVRVGCKALTNTSAFLELKHEATRTRKNRTVSCISIKINSCHELHKKKDDSRGSQHEHFQTCEIFRRTI